MLVRKENRIIRCEAYTNFSRWAKAIERSHAPYSWSIGSSKYNRPKGVWVGDLYTTYYNYDKGSYLFVVSENPHAYEVGVHLFDTTGGNVKTVAEKVIDPSELPSFVESLHDKMPEEFYNSILSTMRTYRFK